MERWNRRVRRTCVGVILLALLLRLGGSGSMAATEAQSMARSPVPANRPGRRPVHSPEPSETPAAAPATVPAEQEQPVTVFTFPTAPPEAAT